jgi:DNA-binding NarL/FixJ family response regulator
LNTGLKVLAIDDHSVVLEGYHSIVKSLGNEFGEVQFLKAQNCQDAHELIEEYQSNPFDLAIIDYNIPAYAAKKLYSGKDVALLVRQAMPQCKIIMMTMHKAVDVMGKILQKVKPEGFINKSDCTSEELIEAFKAVLDNKIFYSKIISDYIKRLDKGTMLEDVDVKIILLLSKGIKNKNLSKYIPLSDSAIEKRKYKMKRLLDVKGGDEELISEALNQGYI